MISKCDKPKISNDLTLNVMFSIYFCLNLHSPSGTSYTSLPNFSQCLVFIRYFLAKSTWLTFYINIYLWSRPHNSFSDMSFIFMWNLRTILNFVHLETNSTFMISNLPSRVSYISSQQLHNDSCKIKMSYIFFLLPHLLYHLSLYVKFQYIESLIVSVISLLSSSLPRLPWHHFIQID